MDCNRYFCTCTDLSCGLHPANHSKGCDPCVRKNLKSVTHDDGAIGFMNVIGEYRRKGLATSVTAAMVKKVLERGEIPFVHIEEDNYKSMNLALKSGFRKYGLVYWVKLK